eukprot:c37288_g1_i1 orf=1-279(-)
MEAQLRGAAARRTRRDQNGGGNDLQNKQTSENKLQEDALNIQDWPPLHEIACAGGSNQGTRQDQRATGGVQSPHPMDCSTPQEKRYAGHAEEQ